MLIVNSEEVQRRAGRNGGWLKSGNTVNVGRKPNEVREEILATVGEGAALMRSILEGTFTQELRGKSGEVLGHREPTITEVVRVWRTLARYALPKQLPPEPAPAPVVLEPDMDRLNWDERVILMDLLDKAAGIEDDDDLGFDDED